MKRSILVVGLLLLTGSAFAEKWNINPETSKIEWIGKKVTGQHNGTVDISSGTVTVEKKKLTGGKVVADMTSIEVLDLEGDSNDKLTGHLKSDDFFSVEKFPTAKFVITSIEKDKITGDLTIKGITNSVSFPAKIKITKDSLSAESPKFEVDRTKYDIKYGSGKFFKGLGDKLIYDDFLLSIKIEANK